MNFLQEVDQAYRSGRKYISLSVVFGGLNLTALSFPGCFVRFLHKLWQITWISSLGDCPSYIFSQPIEWPNNFFLSLYICQGFLELPDICTQCGKGHIGALKQAKWVVGVLCVCFIFVITVLIGRCLIRTIVEIDSVDIALLVPRISVKWKHLTFKCRGWCNSAFLIDSLDNKR